MSIHNEDVNEDKQFNFKKRNMSLLVNKLQLINVNLEEIKEDLSKIQTQSSNK